MQNGLEQENDRKGITLDTNNHTTKKKKSKSGIKKKLALGLE